MKKDHDPEERYCDNTVKVRQGTGEPSDRSEAEIRVVEHARDELLCIIDSLPSFIALIDKNHTIVRLNKSMAQAFGMRQRDLVGRKCFELCHKERKIPDSCPHSRVLNEGVSATSEIFEENLGGHVEVTATPYLAPDGSIIGSVHVVRDINERKRAEEEKEKIMTQLLKAQKLEEVGRLAAGIAHEINTPSQYVASNLDFLRESFEDISGLVDACERLVEKAGGGKADSPVISEVRKALEDADWNYLKDELPEAIGQAQEGIKRVTKIVRAMKEFSHPGPSEKHFQDINRIIETTVTIAKNEWKYCSDVHLDLQENLPPVSCIGDEIGQVLLNMIVNAAHAITEKLGENPEGVKGGIYISTAQKGEDVEIIIRDTGAGIPEKIRTRIFESFFTTKEAGRGTGQGLAIARGIIEENHGGSISLSSEAGKGTSFSIRVPVNDDHPRGNE